MNYRRRKLVFVLLIGILLVTAPVKTEAKGIDGNQDYKITTGKTKCKSATEVNGYTAKSNSLLYSRDNLLKEGENPNDLRIYSATNSLAQKNKYHLYKVDLKAGEYLQGRVSSPANEKIDYDLLLLNSSSSITKTSNYATYVHNNSTIEESLGYIASSNEIVYLCVYCSKCDSTAENYTLDFSITSKHDDGEVDDFVSEAKQLDLTSGGANVTRTIDSPVDYDWYSFTVIDSPAYDKIRFNLNSNSTTNGCSLELYQNIGSGGFAMYKAGSGNQGEVKLPAGTYYLRICSTNTVANFDRNNIPTYTLSVTPATKAASSSIISYEGLNGCKVDYPEGYYYRIDEGNPSYITIKGRAVYTDAEGKEQPSAYATIKCKIKDEQWSDLNRPDMAYNDGTAVTDKDGYYMVTVYLKSACGGLRYNSSVSTHHYDRMLVTMTNSDDVTIATGQFYLLKFSDLY